MPMFSKVLATFLASVMLQAVVSAQQPRRTLPTPMQIPPGIVYVSQRIDLSRQLGADSSILTLDGEPPPPLETTNVTLGVVIDNQGHIVTRLATVTPEGPAPETIVTSPKGRPTAAKFIGMDAVTGLSVLKVEDPQFKAPRLADPAATGHLTKCQLFGFHPQQGQSSTPGLQLVRPRINQYPARIVRAVNDYRYSPARPIYHLKEPELTAVQDGSLLFDSRGALIGVAIYDTSGAGKNLVYPITRVQNIAKAVIQTQSSIAHGWLGAAGANIPPSLNRPGQAEGVIVTAVIPDSPADVAGVKQKDILLSISGRPVNNIGQLTAVLKQLPSDSEVTLKIKRGAEYKFLHAKLTAAPAVGAGAQLTALLHQLESMKEKLKTVDNEQDRRKIEAKVTTLSEIVKGIYNPAPPEVRLRALYGLEIQPLTSQLAEHFKAPGGVLLATVVPGSKSARAGLLAGDIIVKVGEQQVSELASLLDALDKSEGEVVEMLVIRSCRQHTILFTR
jgi:serine protease Do